MVNPKVDQNLPRQGVPATLAKQDEAQTHGRGHLVQWHLFSVQGDWYVFSELNGMKMDKGSIDSFFLLIS